MWDVQKEFPDVDLVFRRVHRNTVRTHPDFPNIREVPHTVFSEPSKKWKKEKLENWDGVSVDWSKYSTAQNTLSRNTPNPERYGVFKIAINDIKNHELLIVVHNPIKDHPRLEDNRSHSLIKGFTLMNKIMLRLELSLKCEWCIQNWAE